MGKTMFNHHLIFNPALTQMALASSVRTTTSTNAPSRVLRFQNSTNYPPVSKSILHLPQPLRRGSQRLHHHQLKRCLFRERLTTRHSLKPCLLSQGLVVTAIEVCQRPAEEEVAEVGVEAEVVKEEEAGMTGQAQQQGVARRSLPL
jgi:hypothetical protein